MHVHVSKWLQEWYCDNQWLKKSADLWQTVVINSLYRNQRHNMCIQQLYCMTVNIEEWVVMSDVDCNSSIKIIIIIITCIQRDIGW